MLLGFRVVTICIYVIFYMCLFPIYPKGSVCVGFLYIPKVSLSEFLLIFKSISVSNVNLRELSCMLSNLSASWMSLEQDLPGYCQQQCWLKATHFIHFHRDLRTPAMPTDSSQVTFLLVKIFLCLWSMLPKQNLSCIGHNLTFNRMLEFF